MIRFVLLISPLSNDRALYLPLCVALLWPVIPSLLIMSAEFGESAFHPARHAHYADRRSIKWAGSFRSTFTEHLEMPLLLLFVQTGSNPTHTPQPPRQLLPLLSWSNPFNLQKSALLQNLFIMAAATKSLSLICCALLSHQPPMPLLIQRSVRRRCRLSLVAFSSFVFFTSRTLRSFKLLIPLSELLLFLSPTLLPPTPVVVLLSAFFRVRFSLSGLLFTCYRCICSYPNSTPFKTRLFPQRQCYSLTRSLRPALHSLRSVSCSLLVAICRLPFYVVLS